MYEKAVSEVKATLMKYPPKDIAVMLIGVTGSGKTTFARELFKSVSIPFKIVSSDQIRKHQTGNELDQSCNEEVWTSVFALIHAAYCRSAPVIVDATFVKKRDRIEMIDFLSVRYRHIVGIWLNTSLEECLLRNDTRECPREEHVVRRMYSFIWGDAEKNYPAVLPRKTDGFTSFARVYNTRLGYYNAHFVSS